MEEAGETGTGIENGGNPESLHGRSDFRVEF